MTDGGLNHHLAASGNFGQVIRKNYPVLIGNRMHHPAASDPATVVGPLCTPLDVLADSIMLPEAELGDPMEAGRRAGAAMTAGFSNL